MRFKLKFLQFCMPKSSEKDQLKTHRNQVLNSLNLIVYYMLVFKYQVIPIWNGLEQKKI